MKRHKQNGEIDNKEYALRLAGINGRILSLIQDFRNNYNGSPYVPNLKSILKRTFLILGPIILLIGTYSIWQYYQSQPLTYDEIYQLAYEYELTDIKEPNTHLNFESGDIRYWEAQKMNKKDLISEFNMRNILLKNAERNNVRYDTQGILGYEVRKILIQKLAEKYELTVRQKFNDSLVYENGDISYWAEQDLSINEIEKRFKIARSIIRNAEQNKIPIKTKGDLGFLVEERLKA